MASDNPFYRDWIRELPCLICRRGAEAAHVVSKGAGGGDEDNLVPLCHEHHMEQHAAGIKSFQDRYAIDLAARARDYFAAYLKCKVMTFFPDDAF
jgi:hypothetical protein